MVKPPLSQTLFGKGMATETRFLVQGMSRPEIPETGFQI